MPTQPAVTAVTGIRRSDLLRGALFARADAFRPPWAAPEHVFVERCTRCGDCLAACPESILSPGRGGFPEIDFRAGGCSFCGRCVDACPDGALAREPDMAPWRLRARILADACLSTRGVTCRVCGDRCEARAIGFTLATRGRATPDVSLSACTGCGGCVGLCPAGAIEMFHSDNGDEA